MELPIINRSYELYKELVSAQDNLSKKHKYSLGVSSEESILRLMEELIMAKNASRPMKSAYLIKAGSILEILTLKIRLLLELKLVNETRVFQMQAKAAEIGRMLGGWLKSVQSA